MRFLNSSSSNVMFWKDFLPCPDLLFFVGKHEHKLLDLPDNNVEPVVFLPEIVKFFYWLLRDLFDPPLSNDLSTDKSHGFTSDNSFFAFSKIHGPKFTFTNEFTRDSANTGGVAFIAVRQTVLHPFWWSICSFQCFKACVFLYLLELYEIFIFKIGFFSAQ